MRADDLPRTADPPAGTPRSAAHAELVARADAVLPGGTTNSARHPAGLEFLVERGAGAELFDVDGHRYLDFVLGGGPLVLGHADPRLLAVLQRAAALGEPDARLGEQQAVEGGGEERDRIGVGRDRAPDQVGQGDVGDAAAGERFAAAARAVQDQRGAARA